MLISLPNILYHWYYIFYSCYHIYFFPSNYSCIHFINITIASPSPAPRSAFRDCRGCHDVSSCATSTRSESLRWHFHSLRIRCYDRRITGDPPSQCGTRLAPAGNLSFPQENAGKVPFTEGKLNVKLTRNYFARIMFSEVRESSQ